MRSSKWLWLFFVALLILPAKVNQVNAEVVVGDQIDIYVGENNQTDQSAAYDSINKRYLVIWHEGVEGTANFYGQLVNNDGSLYGQRITIYQVAEYPYLFAPKVAFDPVNQRFLVVWGWSHIRQPEEIWVTEAFGQFINSDGALYGGTFRISPDPMEIRILEIIPQDITFDAALNRFFVLMMSLKYGPHQLYGRFVNTDSSLGDFFQITNFTSGSGVEQGTVKLGFDSNNDRFLATYSNLDDGDIYGCLLNYDGTMYKEEFIISDTGQSGGGNAITSLPFDQFNNRFLAVFNMAWWLHKIQGQFVNADGSLYGEAMVIFDLRDSNNNSAIFDPVNNKFLVVGTYADTWGQLLNPDGSFFGSSFFVAPLSTSPPVLAGDSLSMGVLPVWMVDLGYGTGRDIVGRIIQWMNTPPALNPIGDKEVTAGELLTFEISGYDAEPDPLSISSPDLPQGAALVDHGDGTAAFSWTPQDFLNAETVLDKKIINKNLPSPMQGSPLAKAYNVTFQISDGEFTGEETITITVKFKKFKAIPYSK